MVSFPPCKINLGLQILSKRPDGFHSIQTCFYPVPWTDVLEVLPSDSFSFTQTGIEIPGKSDENLCVKAYQLLGNDFEIPAVRIHLHKIIPTGAGLGGGSSDAAHTVKSLNDVCNLGLSEEKLLHYARILGSDCSFFIQSRPAIGTGRGDVLEPLKLELKNHYLVILKPDVHISTSEAYAGVMLQKPSTELHKVLKQPVETWKGRVVNDFEPTLFSRHPSLQSIRDQLYGDGALYASMSGSGSSIFGIFKKEIPTGGYPKVEASWSGWL